MNHRAPSKLGKDGQLLSPLLDARFWPKVARGDEDQCWEWQAGRHAEGYGKFNLYPGKQVSAHRMAYALEKGTIPRGFQIDHLCRNPPCVNPRHLEAVTPRENTMRSEAWSALNARKTHCAHGHPFIPENTLHRTRGRSRRRVCRECNRIYCKRNYEKKKARLGDAL